MARYLNVDKIVPDELILEVGGRKFDIGKAPARATTELIKTGSWAMTDEAKADTYQTYLKEMQALLDVLGEDQNGEPCDIEWLLDNVTNAQFNAILSYVGECIQGEQVAQGEVAGNFTAKKGKQN